MDTAIGGFDTLSAANALQKVGFNREQAEVLSHTMARAQGDLATKADVAAVKADITAVKADIGTVRREVDSVRREVASLRSVVFGMVLPMLLGQLGLTVAILFHLLSA